ncbi:peptidase C19, ubiquitin carboxyl-terminal hydrolase 2 [Panus rudis PR-1116 ss-1]|nr:peptidase C19, ubiquitin carboxyl-terminal hydrolase 2 [Panus rudis PR-1116 ss-1]
MLRPHRDKKPTPQELYKARKQREEEEKEAYLPPGLINHGNTCFMNSTLQGLIATPLLHDLVLSGEIPPHKHDLNASHNILLRRSPLLTNGHGVGREHESQRVDGMPLGDQFVSTMQRAWAIQQDRRRETMSPKDILTTIGSKYDQYLDFQQQDAHEFLRHLLDAMRMEEIDIIKQRQPPPPPKGKRKRKQIEAPPVASSSKDVLPPATTSANHQPNISVSDSSPSLIPFPIIPSPTTSTAPLEQPLSLNPESSSHSHSEHGHDHTHDPASTLSSALPPEPLQSFVDMLFGGKLASILVCEKCKKVSLTYEDFNDLSLSIKPEDYVNGSGSSRGYKGWGSGKKRERLKELARKLRFKGTSGSHAAIWNGNGNGEEKSGGSGVGGTGRELWDGLVGAVGMQRSSSVPASPMRRSTDQGHEEDHEPPVNEDPRRRSFDHVRGSNDGEDVDPRAVVRDVIKSDLGEDAAGGLASEAVEDEETSTGEITDGGRSVGSGSTTSRSKSRAKSKSRYSWKPLPGTPPIPPVPPLPPQHAGTSTVPGTPQLSGTPQMPGTPTLQIQSPQLGHVEFVEPDRALRKEKEKDDPWGKLGRRISTSMKMGRKDKDKEKDRDKEREKQEKKERRQSRSKDKHRLFGSVPTQGDDSDVNSNSNNTRITRVSAPGRNVAAYESGSELGDVSDVTKSRGVSPSPGGALNSSSPLASPPITISAPFPNVPTPNPPNASSTDVPAVQPEVEPVATAKPTKASTPRPPKPSREESAYLRRLLADIHPSTPNPFTMIHQALSSTSSANVAANNINGSAPASSLSAKALTAHALLSKMGHLSGIEECLRMFTAVEVLDGENMVGCHRCWKIANGTYRPRKGRSSKNKGKGKEKEVEKDEDDADTEGEGEESEDEDDEDEEVEDGEESPVLVEKPSFEEHHKSSPNGAGASSDFNAPQEVPVTQSSPDLVSTISTPSPSSLFLADTASVSSAPTTVHSDKSISQRRDKPLPPIAIGAAAPSEATVTATATYAGQPIPSISTTAPESPLKHLMVTGDKPEEDTLGGVQPQESASTPVKGSFVASPSAESLLTPRAVKRSLQQQQFRQLSKMNGVVPDGDTVNPDTKSDSESESDSDSDSDDGLASDVSNLSAYSDADASSVGMSPLASPAVSPRASTERVHLTSLATSGSEISHDQTKESAAAHASSTATADIPPSESQDKKDEEKAKQPSGAADSKKKIPRSQQVILRRTYKRYLIAEPPPILVIHLKRFQQTSKQHVVSISGGFKKLDDFVAFPEYLDLTPFLAPRREDFGLGSSKGKGKGKEKDKEKGKGKKKDGEGKKDERCMYRLYAVIVHIGNMLGGHYVAYTALPPKPSSSPSASVSSSPRVDYSAPSSVSSHTESVASSSASKSDKEKEKDKDKENSTDPRRQPRQWAYISDTVVRLTTIEEVLKAKAYICMYERV